MPKHLRDISFLLHHHTLASFLSYREFSVPFPPTLKKKQDSQFNLKITTCQRQKQMLVAWQEMAMPSRDRRGGPLAEQKKILTWLSRAYSYRAHTEAVPPPLKPLSVPGNFFPFQQQQKHWAPTMGMCYNHWPPLHGLLQWAEKHDICHG